MVFFFFGVCVFRLKNACYFAVMAFVLLASTDIPTIFDDVGRVTATAAVGLNANHCKHEMSSITIIHLL